MKEIWEDIKRIVRHNQFIATAIIIMVLVLVWVYGCDSTTKSPWEPSVKVTRAELDAGIDMMNVKINQAYEDLNKQDLFKQELFDNLVIMAEEGTVNPMGVGLGLVSLLGLGAVADNRKKNSVIKTLQKANGNGGTNGTV
jgi:hypothetical protein